MVVREMVRQCLGEGKWGGGVAVSQLVNGTAAISRVISQIATKRRPLSVLFVYTGLFLHPIEVFLLSSVTRGSQAGF